MIYQDTLRTNVIETQTTGEFYAVSTWNAPVGDTAGVGVPGGPSLTNAAWRVGQAEIFSVGQSRNRTFPQVCAWHDVGRGARAVFRSPSESSHRFVAFLRWRHSVWTRLPFRMVRQSSRRLHPALYTTQVSGAPRASGWEELLVQSPPT